MNKQEIFNKVYCFMLKQNQKCEDPNDSENYHYRYKNLRCNIGCLIPDDEYDPKIEGDMILGDLCDPATECGLYFKSKGYTNEDIEWLWTLQIIHDVYEVEEWKSAFQDFAIMNNLTVPELENK